MIKKIIFSVICFITYIQAFWFVKEDIIPSANTAIVSTNDFDPLDWIFSFAKDSIFWLLWLIAIWVFVFIWARLVVARWNPEEFKKALMQMMYAIIWLFVVAIAWTAVKLIAWLSF